MKTIKWENRSSLGFITVIALAFIALTIAGMFLKKNEERVWKKQAIQQMKDLSVFKSRQVVLWKTDIITDSKEIAGSPLLTGTILSWLDHKDPRKKELIKNKFLSILKYKQDHSAMSLTNISGKTLIYISDKPADKHSVKNIVHRVVKTQKEVIGDFYKEATNNAVYIDIAIPIFRAKEQIAAVLVFQINPKLNLFSTLNRWPNYHSSEEFLLFERKGDSVLFINNPKSGSNPQLSFYIPLTDTTVPAVKSVLFGPGIYEGTGFQNHKSLEVISRVKNSPWYLSAKINQKELFAPANEKLKILSWVLIGGFLLLFSILFLILQYMKHHFYKEILEKERKQNILKSHYEYVVKYANDIILLGNENLHIAEANQRAIEAYQYTLNELKEIDIIQLIAPAEREKGIQRLQEMEGTEGYMVETVHQRKDGTLFDVEISYRAIYVDGKKFLHQLIRDITERKRAERALIESEERFRTTLYSTGDAIITTNIEGKILYLNHVAEKLVGWSEKEAAGKPVDEIFRIFSEDTGEEMENPVNKVLHEGKTLFLSNHTNLVTRSGKQIPVGDSGAPIKDADGNITGAVLVFRDLRKEREARKALEESELHYHSLTDNVPVGIFRTRPDGYTTYVNPAWCRISGMKSEQALGNGWLEAVHPEDRETVILDWKNATKNKNISDREYRFLKPDGQIAYVMGHTVPVINSDGEMTGYVGTITDITERKEAENKLSLFRTLIDASNDSVEIINPDTGAFLDVNISGCNSLGYTREEILNKTIFDIDPSINSELLDKTVREIKKSGIRILDGIHQRKNGTIFPVEVSIQIVELDREYMISMARDITERKKIEESLLKLSKAVDQSPASIVVTDVNGIIEYVNPKFTRTTDYTWDEVVGKHFDFLKTGYLSKEEETKLWQDIMAGKEWRGELRTKKKNGESFWEQASISAIKNNEGEITHFVEVGEDITERKEKDKALKAAMEKAQESDRLKTAFLMNMSHEIRTPMNGILGFMSLLDDPGISKVQRAEFMKIINKSAYRLMNTINDIIEISKIEVGDINLKYENVNISEIMQFNYTFFSTQAKEKGLDLLMPKLVEDSKAFINTDKHKIDSIIMNLLRNAIKFTDNGKIEIGNYRKNGDLYFYVKDTGKGIPEDMLDIIFDCFTQTEIGLSRGYDGSGIGLSIVKAYVEALEGHIAVESELGKGSTFTFSIPYRPTS